MYHYKIVDIKEKDVYDGDTLKATIDLGCNVHIKITIRLANINTPEMRGSTLTIARESRDYLRELIRDNNGKLSVRTFSDKKGSFHRYLGILHIQGIDMSINDMLLDNNYAIPYKKG